MIINLAAVDESGVPDLPGLDAPSTLILAAPRGFCAGVVRAIDTVRAALRTLHPPVYVLKEIVHNPRVVEDLAAEGAVFAETLDRVPAGATLVLSAHGVPPSVREEATRKHLQIIDATCPLVTKVHLEAIHYARENYSIVLIGHRNHDEIIAESLLRESPLACLLDEPDAKAVDIQPSITVALSEDCRLQGRIDSGCQKEAQLVLSGLPALDHEQTAR